MTQLRNPKGSVCGRISCMYILLEFAVCMANRHASSLKLSITLCAKLLSDGSA